MKILIVLVLVFCLSGCSPFEIKENLMGMTIGDMNRLDNKIFAQKIKLKSIDVAYEDIVIFSKSKGAHFFNQDKKKYFLVLDNLKKFYPFCINTTKVAIHLKQEDNGIIKVEIACRNHDLGQKVSTEIFGMLGPEVKSKTVIASGSIDTSHEPKVNKEKPKVKRQEAKQKKQAIEPKKKTAKTKKQKLKDKKQETKTKNNWEPLNRGNRSS